MPLFARLTHKMVHYTRRIAAAAPVLVALGAFALAAGFQKAQPGTMAHSAQPGVVAKKVQPGTSPIKLKPGLSLAVRGYITANGRTADVTAVPVTAVNIKQAGKDVYLPGVDVYLRDAVSGKISQTVRTDLSGRFTLFAPQVGRYHLCWKSKVYQAGCDSRFISAGGQPQFISGVRITWKARPGYVALVGHVTTADGTIPRTFEPLLNINSFATVSLADGKGNELSRVYVNNYGDYMIPYVPAKRKLNVTT